MDVDSYLQCLNYMDSIPKVDGVLDITLKVGVPIGTLFWGLFLVGLRRIEKKARK